MTVHDFKKADKQLYSAKLTPEILDVPELNFLKVDGKGDPNTSVEYAEAIELLYGLSYTIKMSKKSGDSPTGYFDFVVPPLEGFWCFADGGDFKGAGAGIPDKNLMVWTAFIRVPDFVNETAFEYAKAKLAKKKPQLDISRLYLKRFKEGLCAQMLHVGPYDDEPATVEKLSQFISEQDYVEDMAGERRHHEVYLSDPRKSAPEKLKTIIRHPIKQA